MVLMISLYVKVAELDVTVKANMVRFKQFVNPTVEKREYDLMKFR